jgi:hypothetical protein
MMAVALFQGDNSSRFTDPLPEPPIPTENPNSEMPEPENKPELDLALSQLAEDLFGDELP